MANEPESPEKPAAGFIIQRTPPSFLGGLQEEARRARAAEAARQAEKPPVLTTYRMPYHGEIHSINGVPLNVTIGEALPPVSASVGGLGMPPEYTLARCRVNDHGGIAVVQNGRIMVGVDGKPAIYRNASEAIDAWGSQLQADGKWKPVGPELVNHEREQAKSKTGELGIQAVPFAERQSALDGDRPVAYTPKITLAEAERFGNLGAKIQEALHRLPAGVKGMMAASDPVVAKDHKPDPGNNTITTAAIGTQKSIC